MKKYLRISLIALLSVLLFSCTKQEDPPQPDFSASILTSSDSQISVSFTDLSTDGPDEWYWTFEGGSPSTSTEQNPTVTYSTPGNYDVTLVVKNGGGENEMVMYDYVNIAKFNNPTWTDVEIEVNYVTKTIPVDGYVLYGKINSTSMSYYAETSGETSTGTQIGLQIYWDNTVDLSEYSTWNLIINSDYVFFTVTNYGTEDLYPFYVNYGASSVSVDYIIIDNDGYAKKTGYYYAYDYMQVRAYKYYTSTTYIYWIEGSNFNLPWDNNQGINLTNSYKSAPEFTAVVKEIKDKEGGNLIPAGAK